MFEVGSILFHFISLETETILQIYIWISGKVWISDVS